MRLPRVPRVRLRRLLTADWRLKLTSLALSVLLWLVAAGEEPARAVLEVDVEVRPPPGRGVLRPAGPARALVVGPRRELLELAARRLTLTRILSDTVSGDRVLLALDPRDVELPRGVSARVLDLEPRAVRVELDSTVQRVVPVHAVVRFGNDSAAHHRAAISVAPGTVRLLGPRSRLRRTDSVLTEPLEPALAGGRYERLVPIDTTGLGPARADPPGVVVTVALEAITDRMLGDVPIRLSSATAAALRPERETATVVVRGPASRVAAVTPESVLVVLGGPDRPGPRRVPLRVLVPPGLTGTAEPDSVRLLPRRRRA